MDFFKEKSVQLQKIDLSRKGSIDSRISDLVDFINAENAYFTTSSCSGRTIVFTNSKNKKKGCEWIFTSHDIVSADEIIDALHSHNGSAILKFEPFILHTQCLSVEDAEKLLNLGIGAGFKNSGMTIGKSGKIIVAVRSTLSLEVPLSLDGTVLVSNEYVSFIVSICNEKMLNNWKRTERFFDNLQKMNEAFGEKLSHKKEQTMKLERSLFHIQSKKVQEVPVDTYYEGFHSLLNTDIKKERCDH